MHCSRGAHAHLAQHMMLISYIFIDITTALLLEVFYVTHAVQMRLDGLKDVSASLDYSAIVLHLSSHYLHSQAQQ